MDVFVANDSVRQSLYRNKRDGSFEDAAVIQVPLTTRMVNFRWDGR